MPQPVAENKVVKTAAERVEVYMPLLEGNRIAMVVNQTSTIGSVHLVDSLFSLGVNIRKVFAPEHGFRGTLTPGRS